MFRQVAIRALQPVLRRAAAPAMRTAAVRASAVVPTAVRRAPFMAVRTFASDATFVIEVPNLGDSITEGTVVGIEKGPGDWANVDEIVMTIETDKVSFDVRAPKAGYVEEILVEEDDTVEIGAALINMKEGEAPAGAESAPAAETSSAPPPPPTQGGQKEEPKKEAAKPAPAKPAPAKGAAPAATDATDAGERSETRVPMNRMRLRISERLKDSQNTAAMLTTFQEVDMHNLIQMRNKHKDEFFAKHGVKLGFMSPFIKASAAALEEIPAVNAVIEDKDIVYRNYVDISVAVASPRGLVVPVIRNASKLGFAETEQTLGDLAGKARDNSLALEDMAGGTFTISNGGVFGSMMGTPILNLPQSAILGMHATKMRPMVVDGEIKARPVMYLALTYDHRLIDGREAVTFLCSIRDKIEDPSRMLLDL